MDMGDDYGPDWDADWSDVSSRDKRYDPNAFAFAYFVFANVANEHDGECKSAVDLMNRFCNDALNEFGPLAYQVLLEWGVRESADIWELLSGMSESGRIPKLADFDRGDFIGGPDFRTELLEPFEP